MYSYFFIHRFGICCLNFLNIQQNENDTFSRNLTYLIKDSTKDLFPNKILLKPDIVDVNFLKLELEKFDWKDGTKCNLSVVCTSVLSEVIIK